MVIVACNRKVILIASMMKYVLDSFVSFLTKCINFPYKASKRSCLT